MKFSLLLLAALLLTATSAYAQSPESRFSGTPVYGGVFGKKKAPPPTPEQIDESILVYDQCKASDMISQYYDCDCLSADFLQIRTENPYEQRINLVDRSRRKCANTTSIAGESYQRCLTWAPQIETNYEAYCTCFANTFAKNFTKSPTDSIKGREFVMTRALTSCNQGNGIAEKRARQNMIDQLKKQGVYETLFPNIKKDQAQGQTRPR